MQNMLDFFTGILNAFASFLMSEPMYYVVTFLLAAIVLRVFKELYRV